jgi:hypothetical protein
VTTEGVRRANFAPGLLLVLSLKYTLVGVY